MGKLELALARMSDLSGDAAYPLQMSNRNFIVDPGFDYATTLSAIALAQGLGYSLPYVMYKGGAGVGGAATGQAVQLNPPKGMNASGGRFAYQHAQSVASTGSIAAKTGPAIFQSVEFVRTLSGRSGTFSAWLWANAPLTISNLIVQQNFGTGGAPSAINVIDPVVNWNVTTVPQRFSARIDLPDTYAGKTLGTAGNDNLTIGLWLPVGKTFSLATAQWQLEECSPGAPDQGAPTAFEYRGFGAEYTRSQRYIVFQETVGFIGNAFAAGMNVGQLHSLPAVMRTTPVCGLGTVSESANCGAINVAIFGSHIYRLFTTAPAAGQVYYDGLATFDARI